MDLIKKYLGSNAINEVGDTWKMANKKFSLSYDSKTKKWELILQGTGKVQRTFDGKHEKDEVARMLYDKGYSEV